ncbi:Hypothetical predicted protein [Scomber scombrus]|uniref:Uncharacterized protein n=1 Tax=Scomber scombrus TaxID=13677 RepID=A0AAV1MR74_SCOSC
MRDSELLSSVCSSLSYAGQDAAAREEEEEEEEEGHGAAALSITGRVVRDDNACLIVQWVRCRSLYRSIKP